jgi:acyl-CoA thioesterase-2
MLTIENLIGSLRFDPLGPDRYRATNAEEGDLIFGGQLLAQSIVASMAGTTGKRVKTLHTVFARSGSTERPVDIAVDRIHSGRAFASSTVTISQGERLIARSQVLLSADEPDLIRHGDTAPDIAPPADESSPDPNHPWCVSIVGDVDLSDPDQVGPPDLNIWTRFVGAPSDPVVDQALIAYASDPFLIGTAMRPHPGVGQAQSHATLSTGVITHTITFHEPASAAEWILLSQHSTYAGRGRCYGTANVFDREGRLVASYVQDAMIRPMKEASGRL